MRTAAFLLALLPGLAGTDAPGQYELIPKSKVPTRWELGAAWTAQYDEDDLMRGARSEWHSDAEESWQFGANYRVGSRVLLGAGYERLEMRHGLGVNPEFLGTDTVYPWGWFGPIIRSNFRADLLTLEHTLNVASARLCYEIRKYPDRRLVGVAFRLEAEMKMYMVDAGLGAVEDHTTQDWEPYNELPSDFGRTMASSAMIHWDDRHAVHDDQAFGMGMSIVLRLDLHFSRYFSLFINRSIEFTPLDPRFEAFSVPGTDIQCPAYELDLSTSRTGLGVAVHF